MRAEHLHSSGLVYMAESPRRQASSRPADVEAVCAPPPFGCHLRCTEQPAVSSVPPSAPSTLLGRQGGSQEPACPADLKSREAHDSLLVTLFQKIHKAAFAMVRAADLTEREVREKEDEAAELRALELQTRSVSPPLARQRTRSAPETLSEVSGARCCSALVFMMDPLPPQGACRDV